MRAETATQRIRRDPIMTTGTMTRIAQSIRRRSTKFASDRKGVAAVEFAFIAPIMLLLFVGTIELSAGISTNRKLSRLSSTVGDLVTQSQQLTASDVEAIMDVSSKIMYPYDEDDVTIVLTGVQITSGQAKVVWSKSRPAGLEKTINSDYTVPAKIKKDGTFLVAAEIKTSYTPSVGWIKYTASTGIDFTYNPIEMREELFLRPRIGSTVELQ
jgi:Flp pilus assembly protein TadG